MKKSSLFYGFIGLIWLASPLAQAYQVSNGKIYDANQQEIKLYGVNWFGFETRNYVPHGLWARNWQDMITQMQNLGFNAVRMPICPVSLQANTQPNSIDYSQNADLQGLSSLQILDLMMAEFAQRGMYVLLDHHRPDCDAISTLWYTSSYSEAQWISDLTFMAERYAGNKALIGIDLKNEPHGEATWGTGDAVTDWKAAAERAASAVLAANSEVLIFVEGVETNPSCSGTLNHWWGGNLEPAACSKPEITASQLVFSPHVYGPDVYGQPYFSDASFPSNMTAIWDAHFGFLVDEGYAVIPGEFGGRYGHSGDSRDKTWQNAVVDYFISKDMHSFFYWSWNPNSGDTGGILQDDWSTVWDDKVALLQRLMSAENSNGNGTDSGSNSGTDSSTDNGGTDAGTDSGTDNGSTDGNTDSGTGNGSTDGNTDTGTDSSSTPTLLFQSADGRCGLSYSVKSQWNQGLVGEVHIHNLSASTVEGWHLQWTLSNAASISNYWNVSIFGQNSELHTTPLSWNQDIPAQGSVSFGFQLQFNALPAEYLGITSLTCGSDTSYSNDTSSQSADYQAGFEAAKALCASQPESCGIDVSGCEANAQYSASTGALYLPSVRLTGTSDDQRWEVYLEQQSDALIFEVRGLNLQQ